MSNRLRAVRGDDGFTLTETIVSLTIFAIVSAAAVLALVTGIKTNTATSDRVAAAQLAQQATDRARAMPRALLAATPTTTVVQTVGNKAYSVTRTVSYPGATCLPAAATPTPGDTAVRKVVVRVDVAIPGESASSVRTVRMDSVLAC